MGQKINPIIFRQSITRPDISSWISQKENIASLQHQDLEIRNFLSFLLRSQGVLLRSCKIRRSAKKLLIEADFYFSYLFAKQSKFFWAKNLFRTIKKKYVDLKKMRDLKAFIEEVEQPQNDGLESNSIRTNRKSKYILLQKKRKKCFLQKKKKNFIFKSTVLTYKHRFCFFLLVKKAREISFLKKDKKNLLNLNKYLCESLHHFTGIEDINLKICSTQLDFLPSFKLYQRVLHKKLFFFQRNKDLKKYFSESLETLYFILGTFGYGNASLLGKLISYMIENNRKHTQSVRFLKKSLQILFQKLPPNFFAVDGIKILIKGRFNKRRRTKTIVLQQGQISLQTIKTPIDYHQTQAITLYGAGGQALPLPTGLRLVAK